jgi:hypothetical protein
MEFTPKELKLIVSALAAQGRMNQTLAGSQADADHWQARAAQQLDLANRVAAWINGQWEQLAMNHPQELIEAVERTLIVGNLTLEDYDESARYNMRNTAIAILDAAYPLIRDAVIEECAILADIMASDCANTSAFSLLSAARFIATRIRALKTKELS